MKYMLIHAVDESIELTDDEEASAQDCFASWLEEMIRRGVNLHGGRLQPVSDATTVRVRENEILVADGPFAGTKEQIAGYDIIECEDLDEAIEVASKHPTARIGTIEIRPLWRG